MNKTKKEEKVSAPYVTTPYRETKKIKREHPFVEYLALKYPSLKKELKIAGIEKDPVEFVKECLIGGIIVGVLFGIIIAIIAYNFGMDMTFVFFSGLLSFVLIGFFAFNSLMLRARLIIKKREREIDKELVFCGRHLLIELRAGTPLFDAMLGVSQDYGEVSKEFNKIVEKITLGVPSTSAIHEVAQTTPSSYLNRVLLQIANSLTSGSDIADSLETVLDQISQEQIIKLKEYGQKLNPIAMFYMVFGIIMPSIGITFAIIVLSLLGSGLGLNGTGLMLIIFAIVVAAQIIFISIADRSRPVFYI
jgi:flagellar protein FlaJ